MEYPYHARMIKTDPEWREQRRWMIDMFGQPKGFNRRWFLRGHHYFFREESDWILFKMRWL